MSADNFLCITEHPPGVWYADARAYVLWEGSMSSGRPYRNGLRGVYRTLKGADRAYEELREDGYFAEYGLLIDLMDSPKRGPMKTPIYTAPTIPYTVEQALERARHVRPNDESDPYDRAAGFPGHYVAVAWSPRSRQYAVQRMWAGEVPVTRYDRLAEALDDAMGEYRRGVPGSLVVVTPRPEDIGSPLLSDPPFTSAEPDPAGPPWYTWRHAEAGRALRLGPAAVQALLTARNLDEWQAITRPRNV